MLKLKVLSIWRWIDPKVEQIHTPLTDLIFVLKKNRKRIVIRNIWQIASKVQIHKLREIT